MVLTHRVFIPRQDRVDMPTTHCHFPGLARFALQQSGESEQLPD